MAASTDWNVEVMMSYVVAKLYLGSDGAILGAKLGRVDPNELPSGNLT